MPPIIPTAQQFSQAGVTIAQGLQTLGEEVDEFAHSEAYRKLVQIGVSPVAAAVAVQQQTQTNVAAIGKLVTNAVDFEQSFGPGGINTVRTFSPTTDIYGSGVSSVKGAVGFSVLDFSTTSSRSEAHLRFDTVASSIKLGASLAEGTLGFAFNAGAHIVKSGTEVQLFHIGDTAFSLYSEGGYGAQLRAALLVDQKGGRIGLGGGFGRTGALELRFRRRDITP